MRNALRVCLIFGLLLTGARSVAFSPKDPPLLSIRFAETGVEFNGTVDSEETGQMLATSVKSVRPDLAIINRGLQVDPEATMPDLEDLKSLLEELGLSTHEGMLVFWDDRVLLSGLTDSVISVAALKILIEPLMIDRNLINRICIVNTDDLPDIKVNLTTLESQEALLDFESYPTAEELFEIPGLPLAKIYPALVMLSDLSRINGGGGNGIAPVRAQPLALPKPQVTEAAQEPGEPVMIQALPAERIVHYVDLPSILFSRSTQLLQADQTSVVEELVSLLLEPPFAGNPITISPVRCQGGAAAFNEYLCENRATKVKELLAQRGIDETLFTVDIRESSSPVDTGEVKLQVIVPEAMEEEAEAPQSETEAPQSETEAPEEDSEPDDSGQVAESAATETVETEQ
ncbi:MAG: hypothetical protein HRU46_07035 [Verrucomicrobiales bacterium]|nr:hypothetical protein [Verrucomicrobiales bacterium]